MLLDKLGLGLAAFLRAAGTAALHVAYRLAAYAERRLALGSTGVRRGGRITILIGINRFLTWVDSYHTVHVRHPHYLVTYLHQLTSPSSYPVLPQDCSLLRLAVFALRAATVSGGVRVEGSLLAAAFFAEALGTGAGTAAVRPADRSFGLWSCPPAIYCSQCGEGGPP